MARLSPEEIKEILNKKERWVALTTSSPNGYPHTVPIGYFLVGEALVMGCRDGTQKVKNIERDPRVSVLWENGRGKDSIKGILFQGDAQIVRDPKERMKLKIEACRQRGRLHKSHPREDHHLEQAYPRATIESFSVLRPLLNLQTSSTGLPAARR